MNLSYDFVCLLVRLELCLYIRLYIERYIFHKVIGIIMSILKINNKRINVSRNVHSAGNKDLSSGNTKVISEMTNSDKGDQIQCTQNVPLSNLNKLFSQLLNS